MIARVREAFETDSLAREAPDHIDQVLDAATNWIEFPDDESVFFRDSLDITG